MEVQEFGVRHQVPTMDRISNLPRAILDNIFVRLPIKEAVRTSTLSKQWTSYWVELPKLEFDHNCGGKYGDIHADGDHFAKFVYHVLLSHCGQIRVFKLSTSSGLKLCESDVGSWIRFLSKKCTSDVIKAITFQPYTKRKYKVPSCLFSCQQLIRLNMRYVSLELTSNLLGFRNLVSLQLQDFTTNGSNYCVDAEAFSSLIRQCPFLERLSLVDFKMPGRFVIEAPKLKYLCLCGRFQVIFFYNCMLLEHITLYKEYVSRSDKLKGNEMHCNLFKNHGLVSHLKRLVLSGFLLKFMHVRDILETPLSEPSQLKELVFHEVSLRGIKEGTVALAILKLFPNLQDFEISARSNFHNFEESLEIFDALDSSSCYFNALQTVKVEILHISEDIESENYFRPEMEFIKFVLARSPVLKKLTIVINETAEKFEKILMRRLLSFDRASEQLRISCYISRNELSDI